MAPARALMLLKLTEKRGQLLHMSWYGLARGRVRVLPSLTAHTLVAAVFIMCDTVLIVLPP